MLERDVFRASLFKPLVIGRESSRGACANNDALEQIPSPLPLSISLQMRTWYPDHEAQSASSDSGSRRFRRSFSTRREETAAICRYFTNIVSMLQAAITSRRSVQRGYYRHRHAEDIVDSRTRAIRSQMYMQIASFKICAYGARNCNAWHASAGAARRDSPERETPGRSRQRRGRRKQGKRRRMHGTISQMQLGDRVLLFESLI